MVSPADGRNRQDEKQTQNASSFHDSHFLLRGYDLSDLRPSHSIYIHRNGCSHNSKQDSKTARCAATNSLEAASPEEADPTIGGALASTLGTRWNSIQWETIRHEAASESGHHNRRVDAAADTSGSQFPSQSLVPSSAHAQPPDPKRPRDRSVARDGSRDQPAGRRRPHRRLRRDADRPGNRDRRHGQDRRPGPDRHARPPPRAGLRGGRNHRDRHGRRAGRRVHLDRLHAQHRSAHRHPGRRRVRPRPGRPGRPLQRVRHRLRQQEPRREGTGRDRAVGRGRAPWPSATTAPRSATPN